MFLNKCAARKATKAPHSTKFQVGHHSIIGALHALAEDGELPQIGVSNQGWSSNPEWVQAAETLTQASSLKRLKKWLATPLITDIRLSDEMYAQFDVSIFLFFPKTDKA